MRNAQQRAMQAYLDRNAYGLTGLGDSQQSDAATVASSLAQSTKLATAVGGPVAGGIVAAAGAIAQIVSLFGPNPNNNYATEVVNQVEADVMQPNLSAWQALSAAEKTPANQAAAEAVFNSGWAYVLSACNNPALGSAGINCIGDRQRGGKFDWFAAYYDPIANDPAVAANVAAAAVSPATSTSGTVTGAVDSTVAIITTATGFSPLMIGVALIALALVVSD
jgi:hypothetical protein